MSVSADDCSCGVDVSGGEIGMSVESVDVESVGELVESSFKIENWNVSELSWTSCLSSSNEDSGLTDERRDTDNGIGVYSLANEPMNGDDEIAL